MQALLRRGQQKRRSTMLLQVGNLQLDFRTKTAQRGQRRIELTAKEFALLAYLMEHAGIVVSRAQLLRDVWRMDFDPGTKWSMCISAICDQKSNTKASHHCCTQQEGLVI